jgi:hypothetical protein
MLPAAKAVLERAAGVLPVLDFAIHCIKQDDAVCLMFLLVLPRPGMNGTNLARLSARYTAPKCLRFALEMGATWVPADLIYAVKENCLETLEVVVRRIQDKRVLLAATCLGRVGFWMCLHRHGYPNWTVPSDEEASEVAMLYCIETISHIDNTPPPYTDDLTLVVSSDLLRSGPLLLYAAERGVPLTPRMEGMLREVRHRAQALAGCFHRAKRLSQGPGAAARRWSAMGRVCNEEGIMKRIATYAKISIVERRLVE